MADNILKMDYEEADATIDLLRAFVTIFENVEEEVEAIATALEGGALLGKAGDAFVSGIRTKAIPAIEGLREATGVAADFLSVEKEDMMAAEKASAALF